MPAPLRVLIVEDNPDDAELMALYLNRAGFQPEWQRVETETDYIAKLDPPPDLILCDWRLPRFSGLHALRLLRERYLDVPFIIVSGSIGEEVAIEALREGAYDYVLKDRPIRLGMAAWRALNDKEMRKERQRTEQALAENEKRYRRISEIISDYAYAFCVNEDKSFICEWVVGRFEGITGFTVEEVSACEGWIDLIHPDDRQIAQERNRRLLAGEERVTEFRIVRKDGVVRWLRDRCRPIWNDEEKRVTHLYGAVEDITESKLAEQALRERETDLRKAQQLALVGSWVWHIAGNRLECSDEIFRIFGLDKESAGDNLIDAIISSIHPADRAAFKRTCQSLIHDKTAPPIECRVLRHNGTVRTIWVETGDLICNDAGNAIRVSGMVQDITQRKEAEEQLRLQAAALESAANAILITDRNGNIQWSNPAFTALTGFTAKECRGCNPQELLDSGLHDAAFYKKLWDTILAGQVWRGEFINRRKDGTLYTEETTITPLADAQGEITNFISIRQDVTAQKQHEREVAKVAMVSAALRTAATRAEMLPVILDQLTSLLSVEAAALEMLNPDTGQLLTELGNGVWAPLTGVSIPPGAGISAQVLATGQPYLNNDARNDPRLFRPDAFGDCRAMAGAPLVAQGQIIGLLWIGSKRSLGDHDLRLLTAIADIAANAIRRAALHEQTEAQARQMAQIMDSVPQGMLLADARGRVLLVNRVAKKHLALLAPAESIDTLTQLGDRLFADLLTTPSNELWHEVQVGTYIFEIIARPIPDGSKTEQWVLIINDVTQARKVQEQLQQQERLATVGQLAGGIAHDFNNVMAVIMLYVQMLGQLPNLTDSARQRLTTINSQAHHAIALIRQVLDFSRQAVLERQPMDLLLLVKEQVKLLERTLPESIVLRLDYAYSEYVIHADPTRMQQIIMNLAINARDAMPAGGSLHIGLDRIMVKRGAAPLPQMTEGDWVQLTVSDNGTGISPKVLPHIFNPFFTTKAPGKGTGLGLAQVYGIVKQHEGHIDVKSQVNVGTTFSIYLPTLILQVPPRIDKGPANLIRGRGEKMLVVEDDPALRLAMVEMLTLLDYQVMEAANGQEALTVLAKHGHAIELVLSDMVMPEMGGIALLQTLRQQGWTKPVILLTGHPLDQELAVLQAHDVQALLLKPPSLEQLTRTIAEALKERVKS